MKKYFLFIILMLLCITNVYANEKFYYNEEKVSDMWITRDNGNFKRSANPYIVKRKSDNSYVYCVEPFSQVDSSSNYIVDNDYTKYGLTKEQMDRVNLIIYYGYGYDNHNEKKWYGITQFLIWKTVNPKDTFYFSKEKNGVQENLYIEEINEIEELITKHNIEPNFIKDYVLSTNSSLNIKSNIDLNEYNIITDINYKLENNNIIVDKLSVGKYEFKLVKKNNKYSHDYLLYYSSDSQNIILPGNSYNYDKVYKFNIIVKEGIITISKENSITSEKLEGATYGVYCDDMLVDKIKTDKNGMGKISLPFGKYVIKEIEAPAGYRIDSTEYNFLVDENNLNKEFNFKDDKIVIKIPDTGLSYNKVYIIILLGLIGIIYGKKKYKVY